MEILGKRSRHDVVVVGARCAGAATAMLLARAGLDVMVFERAAPGSDTMSTHALMRAGVTQLHRWGLLGAIVASGAPPIRRVTFHYERESSVVTIKPSAGVDALYAPRRTVLDPVLVAAACEAGATVRFETAVVALLRDEHGRVTGVRVRDAAGTYDVHAGLVIGADGIHSFVARDTGATVERQASSTSEAVYGYWDGLDADGYEWFYRGGFSAGCIPTNDGATCVFTCMVGTPESAVRVGAHERHAARLAAVAPDLAARLRHADGPRGGRYFAGLRGYMRRAHGPGWALVGDAGYFKDPVAAHGITDALRDAEVLAHAVERGLGRRDEAAHLAAYQAERDRLSLPLFEVADEIAGFAWDDEAVHSLLLRLNSSMALEVEALVALDAAAAADGAPSSRRAAGRHGRVTPSNV